MGKEIQPAPDPRKSLFHPRLCFPAFIRGIRVIRGFAQSIDCHSAVIGDPRIDRLTVLGDPKLKRVDVQEIQFRFQRPATNCAVECLATKGVKAFPRLLGPIQEIEKLTTSMRSSA